MFRHIESHYRNEMGASNTSMINIRKHYRTSVNQRNRLMSGEYIAWIAMIFSIVIWFKFSASSGDTLGNTKNLYRIVLVIFAGIYSILTLMKYSKYVGVSIKTPFILLFLYGVTALLSSLMMPKNAFYTMWKAIEIMIDVVAIIGIIAATRSVIGPITAYRWLMIYNTIMLVLVVIGVFTSPNEALRSSRGVIPFFIQGHFPVLNPNTVGFICAQLVLHNVGQYFRAEKRSRKYISATITMLSIALLIFAQSRTSIAGVMTGLFVYLILDKKKSAAAGLTLIGAVMLIFTSGMDIVESYLLRGQSEELVRTLSGRTHGWAAAWELFMQSPWTGHGFAAAARTQILAGQNASTLHGAFFDVIVGVGIIGLIPWLAAIILMLAKMTRLTLNLSKWARNKYERSIHAEMAAMTAILLIRSATSSGIAMHEHAFMLLLCIIGYSYMMYKQIKERSRIAYRSSV